MASYVESFAAKMDWGKPFQRTGKLPLDRSSIFSSYADAVKYASGVADSDSRKLAASSYVGQIITVYENSVVTVYKIEEDRSLVEVGRATEGDGKSISLDNGILSLFGFDKATAGQQLRIVNKGTAEKPDLQIEWFTPDTSTVEGLSTTVGALKETVDGVTDKDGKVTKEGLVHKVAALEANKADKSSVYTKQEIDGKLTGALHYQGTYATFQALLDAIAAETDPYVPAVGDVWNITTAGGTDASGTAIKAGDNVIYNGTGWDVSSGTVDLSSYYTSAQVDDLLDKKVDIVEGERLMTDEEGERLAEVTKVEASETNGNIKIDGAETQVYELPTANASTIGGVKSSTEKDQVAVDADGVMSLNTVSGSKVDGAVAEASKVTNTFKIGSKTFDGSEAVEVTAEDVPLPGDVVRTSTVATTENVGVVKANATQDGVSVESDGKMVINDISASKVKGIVDEAAKVTNKLTAGSKTFDGSAAVEITAEDLGAMKTADMGSYVNYKNIATTIKTGVVKSSTAQDNVTVGTDGVMTVNALSAYKVIGTVSKAADAEKLGGVTSADILDGTSGKVKSATAAEKLATARDITLSGDATGTASFDGSANAEVVVALKNVGTAGTYTKVTTDAQGRVTSGSDLTATDIPDLTLAKITDAGDLAGLDKVAYGNLNDDLQARMTELERVDHEHENKAVLDGITSSKVTTWDETAGKIDGKADKATTLSGYGITDAYTKTEIDAKVAGAYHFAGSCATFADLTAAVEAGTITPKAGDVYNITTGGGEDMNGTTIKSGDNVAYVDGEVTGWDCLGGIMDLSAYSTTEQVQGKLDLKADKSTVEGIDDRLGTAETKVSNLETTVGEHGTKLTGLDTDVTNLKNTVGDDTKGLVKNVADNTADIQTLNGDENTEGSVKKLVAASAKTINDSITEITKAGGTIETKVNTAVTAHNTATNAHANLFAAKQNKAVYANMTFEASDFVENTDGVAPYKATKTVTGLDTTKNYSPNITPDVASCSIISAAGFYPTAVVDAGTLTLYCRTAPTAAIVVSGTFTEIQ